MRFPGTFMLLNPSKLTTKIYHHSKSTEKLLKSLDNQPRVSSEVSQVHYPEPLFTILFSHRRYFKHRPCAEHQSIWTRQSWRLFSERQQSALVGHFAVFSSVVVASRSILSVFPTILNRNALIIFKFLITEKHLADSEKCSHPPPMRL